MDCSLSGSSVHGIFRARVLEWIALSFSRGPSRPRNRTWVSCITGRRFTVWATREALPCKGRLYFDFHRHHFLGFSINWALAVDRIMPSPAPPPGGASDKEPACQYRKPKRSRFHLQVRNIPWRTAWQPTPVLLPGESYGQRSLEGHSPRGCSQIPLRDWPQPGGSFMILRISRCGVCLWLSSSVQKSLQTFALQFIHWKINNFVYSEHPFKF